MAVSLYAARKLGKATRPGASKARARKEQQQRELALGVLQNISAAAISWADGIEAATRRWADAVNKKETK